MSDIKNSGPAFPTLGHVVDGEWETLSQFTGITMRDYFAAKAMQGFISSANFNDANFDGEAEAAYLVADSMLKAREV